MTLRRLPRTLEYLVTAAVILVAVVCLCYASARVTLLMHNDPFDHAIFARAGAQFAQTGQFYLRTDDLSRTYAPGAAVFKFPPVYQLFIAPWVKDGVSPLYYRYSYLVCLLLYSAGIVLLLRHILQTILADTTRNFRLRFAGLAIAAACVAEPFFSGFFLVVGELPIFFCLVACMVILRTKPVLASVLIAIAAATKLYPAFLLLYGCAQLEKQPLVRFLCGFIVTTVLVWIVTLLAFGWQEPLYYLTSVLPVLLQEHPVAIVENLSVIFFLFPDGITHTLADNVLQVIRLMTLTSLAWITFSYKKNRPATHVGDALLYGLFVTSMIMCLANYWLQYEVLLLIPALITLAAAMHSRQLLPITLAAFLLLLVISSNDLYQSILVADARENYQALMQRYEVQGWLSTLWYISPRALIVGLLAPLKPLAPFGLWILTATLVLQQQSSRVTR